MESNTVERRKQELISEGYGYRGSISAATARLKSGLQPASLSHGVVSMLAKTAIGFFAGRATLGGLSGSGGLGGTGLHKMMPLVLNAASRLSKISFSKATLLRGGLAAGVLGVAGAVAFYFFKKRRASAGL